ncbi:hypothetical protein CEXT_682091 [Caerostris extrusa]|uniref:Uncharacterized protein n=1 Tax=Caerostris extrusa TaxID=172846 RepID=A0AAV4UFA4_CAEEX|nr:hypothetical protein CEXT_682091 [Caerostris extrusa]
MCFRNNPKRILVSTIPLCSRGAAITDGKVGERFLAGNNLFSEIISNNIHRAVIAACKDGSDRVASSQQEFLGISKKKDSHLFSKA